MTCRVSSEVTLSACIANSKQAQTVCADSFAPFSKAGASGEAGDFSTTDLISTVGNVRGSFFRF